MLSPIITGYILDKTWKDALIFDRHQFAFQLFVIFPVFGVLVIARHR